jgi:hypothetical protein
MTFAFVRDAPTPWRVSRGLLALYRSWDAIVVVPDIEAASHSPEYRGPFPHHHHDRSRTEVDRGPSRALAPGYRY